MSITYPVTATNITQEIDWTALYADHVKRIYNFFRYRVGNDQVAEDLTATTFEKAWRKRRQFRGKRDEFVHWLYVIARNVANDYFRKSPTLVGLEEIATYADPASISEDVERQIEFQRLVYYINQLSERDREIVTLKYGAGLNNRQIAKQMKLSESNVGSILHRTIQKLRQQMEISHE